MTNVTIFITALSAANFFGTDTDQNEIAQAWREQMSQLAEGVWNLEFSADASRDVFAVGGEHAEREAFATWFDSNADRALAAALAR